MQLTRNGVSIQVDDEAIMDMVLRNVMENRHPALRNGITSSTPRIGEQWPGQGGIYAGIMRGRDGAPDYHLIVGPEHDGELNWKAAMEWATGVNVNLHKDFTLPFRAEQALLFANVPELFEKTWYWSREQHAAYSDCAWMQDFLNGTQSSSLKDNEWRARAVRRLVI